MHKKKEPRSWIGACVKPVRVALAVAIMLVTVSVSSAEKPFVCEFDKFYHERPLRILQLTLNLDGNTPEERVNMRNNDDLSLWLGERLNLPVKEIDKEDMINFLLWIVPQEANFVTVFNRKYNYKLDEEAIIWSDQTNQWLASLYFVDGDYGRLPVLIMRNNAAADRDLLVTVTVVAVNAGTSKENFTRVIDECG